MQGFSFRTPRYCNRLFLSEADCAHRKDSGKSGRGQGNRLCAQTLGGFSRRPIGRDTFHRKFFRQGGSHFLAANLVVVPIVEVIVIVGFVSVFAGVFSMWISTCFNEVNNLLSWFTLKFVMLANAVPYCFNSNRDIRVERNFFLFRFRCCAVQPHE